MEYRIWNILFSFGLFYCHCLKDRNETIRCDMAALKNWHVVVAKPRGCTNDDFVNSICNFECQQGYRMPLNYKNGYMLSICNNNGEWYPSVPPCLPIKDCKYPILSQYLKFSTMCNQLVNVSCQVSCENNLKVLGPSNITCRDNGTWSEIPICGCKQPPPISNAIADNCKVEVDTGCHIKCKSHLHLSGSSFIKCLPSGEWNVTAKCVRLCPQLNSFPGIEVLNDCSHLEGSNCRIGCTDDLILVGSDNITCLSNGKWSSTPQCGCDKPSISNSEISLKECDLRPYGRCLIRCKTGYVLIGSSVISCYPVGGWHPPSFCASKTIEGICPRSYHHFAGRCYKIHRRITGSEVLRACHDPSRTLVVDQSMIYSFVVALMRTQKLGCVWTGINDLQKPGVWKDNLGRKIHFLPWSVGYPTITENGECVLISEFDNFKYQTHSCYLIKCNVLCERPENFKKLNKHF